MWDTLNKASRRYGHVLFPVLAVALGGGLRLAGLGASSLRTDEIYIVERSEGALWALAGRVGETVMGAPMEFFLRNALLRFSHSEFFLRLPDALFGTLSVLILLRLAARLFDPTTGIVASVLLAISGMHLFHSQDARYYALFCLLSLVSTFLLLRGQESNRSRTWAAYTLSMIVGFYTCYFMAFVALVHALYMLGPRVLPGKWRQQTTGMAGFVAAGFATVLAFAPWLLVYRPIPNLPYPSMSLAPTAITLLVEFSGGKGFVNFVFAGLFAAGLVFARDRHRSSAVLCLLFVALPFPLILWLDNRFQYFFAARQMIFALPFFLAVVAYGIVRVSKTAAKLLGRPALQMAAVVAAVVLISIWSVEPGPHSRKKWPQEDWRGAARYLIDRMELGDVLVMTKLPLAPPDGDNIGWYLRALGPEPAPYRIVNAWAVDPTGLKEMTRQGRVWVAIASQKYFEARPELFEEIQRDFTKEAAFSGGVLFGKIVIYRSRQ
jgi:hypothetical protein